VAWTGVKIRSGSDWVDTSSRIGVGGFLTLRLIARPEVANLRTRDDAVIHFTLMWTLPTSPPTPTGSSGRRSAPDFSGDCEHPPPSLPSLPSSFPSLPSLPSLPSFPPSRLAEAPGPSCVLSPFTRLWILRTEFPSVALDKSGASVLPCTAVTVHSTLYSTGLAPHVLHVPKSCPAWFGTMCGRRNAHRISCWLVVSFFSRARQRLCTAPS